MSGFGSRLTHTVTILRATGSGVFDDYGHETSTPSESAALKAAIQPRTEREQALLSQAGAAVSDHVIYMYPADLSTADAIYHDAAECPVENDLPTSRYEVIGVPNAAGLGHHLEVEARLVASPAEAAGS